MLRWGVVITGLVAASGCGPIQATSLMMDAELLLHTAKSADAPKLAVYDYTKAELYLHKAKEEEGYADHEIAIAYAQKAKEHAAKARDIALKQTKSEERPTP